MLPFSKRKIVSMMREVFPAMLKKDRLSLAKQLDNANKNKAIQGTWELAVICALRQQFDAKPHFTAPHTKKTPDAEFAIGLDRNIVLDVKTLSGDPWEFKTFLHETSKKIFGLANRVRSDSGRHLSIQYFEWRRTGKSVRPRMPSVSEDAADSADLKRKLADFLLDDACQEVRIAVAGIIHAGFKKVEVKHPTLNYTCSIPNHPQSVENNHSSFLIKKANEQLTPFRSTHYTGLAVCDGGNSIISDPNRFHTHGSVSGADIMNYVIEQTAIDFIVCLGRRDEVNTSGIVLTPQNKVKRLAVSVFFNSKLSTDISKSIEKSLQSAFASLPVPLLHGDQAKSRLSQDDAIGSSRAYYCMPSSSWLQGESRKMNISSRAFFEFLSGRMDPIGIFRETLEAASKRHRF